MRISLDRLIVGSRVGVAEFIEESWCGGGITVSKRVWGEKIMESIVNKSYRANTNVLKNIQMI